MQIAYVIEDLEQIIAKSDDLSRLDIIKAIERLSDSYRRELERTEAYYTPDIFGNDK